MDYVYDLGLLLDPFFFFLNFVNKKKHVLNDTFLKFFSDRCRRSACSSCPSHTDTLAPVTLPTLAYHHIFVLLYNLFLLRQQLHACTSVGWILADSIQIKGQFIKLLPDIFTFID